ncbi:hypothetical protein [Pseudoxanthomonas sacheonensis]|uniref:hypothetical protein n=1 Tax=Pseudoxanthomonas sacheonensis TaxID=443615 RepID=UPI0013D106CA|nr:hypothetical protein [Pseudoxanthomonas sacheonensis]
MNPHALFLRPVHEQVATAHGRCFAPFEKGGYGGFAFALALDRAPEQEQIPLNPPFSKGEAEALLHRADVCGKVAS